jgi:hypothetical protein
MSFWKRVMPLSDLNPLSLSKERVRKRFHARITSTNLATSLALNLSRRDRNRADLSSDKER